jgi:hypothetical protein
MDDLDLGQKHYFTLSQVANGASVASSTWHPGWAMVYFFTNQPVNRQPAAGENRKGYDARACTWCLPD